VITFADSGSGSPMEIEIDRSVEEITKRFGRAYMRGCSEQARFPSEFVSALAAGGLLGLGLDPEQGGVGGGLIEECLLVEGLSRRGITANSFLVSNFCRSTVARYGSPEVQEWFTPSALDGSSPTSFAITEAESGTNSFAMRTRAHPIDTGWSVNGEKTFISHAGEARQMLVVAKTNEDDSGRGRPELSMFALRLPDERVSILPMNVTAALPDRTYTVFFDDVPIPTTNIVGRPGQAQEILFAALNRERILAAAQAVGLGAYALSRGVDYARERAPFGRPIGSYQAIQHRFAEAFAHLSAARLVCYSAARAVDAGSDDQVAPNMAKYLGSEAANAAMDIAIQVHGGHAFDRDVDLVTSWEMVRLTRIAPINNESVLSLLARHGLGLPRSH
jgi:acyl-CoA dehydrogenase